MDKTSIQVLFVEDSEVDVELALRSLEQGGFEVSWDRVDLEGSETGPGLVETAGDSFRADGAVSGGRLARAVRREIQLKA